MKVMWFTFAPIGKAAKLLYGSSTQSGGWVDAALNKLLPYIKEKTLELQVVALDSSVASVTDEETSVVYRTIDVERRRGKRGTADDKAKFKAIIDEFCPDIIQIWGTEFSFGLDVIDAAGNIPVCFNIQGVMDSLAKHPLGDIPAFKLFKELGITSFFKFRSLEKWHKINKRHVALESEMIAKSAGLIVDNDWTCAQYAHCTDKFYFAPLAVNRPFLDKNWELDNCERHTLFTVAGGICPQKGIHDAVLAVAKLKDKYPDVKLYIPGAVQTRKPEFLYDSVFIRHIRKIINQYGLENNVCFAGRLSADEMAQRMEKSHVFVMPSCVETHSSSLREAMFVGTPCVSASVGSVPEFLHNGNNGFLYRYGESETLAYYIDKIFSDDALAKEIGSCGKKIINEKYEQDTIGEKTYSLYQQMITEAK